MASYVVPIGASAALIIIICSLFVIQSIVYDIDGMKNEITTGVQEMRPSIFQRYTRYSWRMCTMSSWPRRTTWTRWTYKGLPGHPGIDGPNGRYNEKYCCYLLFDFNIEFVKYSMINIDTKSTMLLSLFQRSSLIIIHKIMYLDKRVFCIYLEINIVSATEFQCVILKKKLDQENISEQGYENLLTISFLKHNSTVPLKPLLFPCKYNKSISHLTSPIFYQNSKSKSLHRSWLHTLCRIIQCYAVSLAKTVRLIFL
uniref:Col_cuticle_N domain-containing protein n=1 Tax=Heterorhabditis bacteriophora TaxID=37862 RepID=A0A1I7WJR2_HETBA